MAAARPTGADETFARAHPEDVMLCVADPVTEVLADDWTVVTVDGSPAAHWEHTVAVTADGPRILTPRPRS